ncbi:MAG: O-antigen ligase family protein [Parvularculaceae bacterium]
MRASWRDKRDTATLRLFYGLFFLLPLTAVFGHRGVAPWLLIASFPAFLRGDFWQAAFGKLFDHPSVREPVFAGLAAIAALSAWIAISAVWSPRHMPELAFYILAPALVGGSVVWFSMNLTREWAWRLGRAFLLAIVGGMLVLSFEGVTDGVLRRLLPPPETGPRDIVALGRGVTALAPALFPAAAIAVRQWSRSAALGVLALGVAAAVTNDVLANVVAIGFGLAAALIALNAQKTVLVLAGWGAVALLVLTPFAALLIPVDAIYDWAAAQTPHAQEMMASSLHRLAVWKSVAGKSFSCLPFGCGADYARVWKETAPMIEVPGSAIELSIMPTHPHNGFLEIWLELGVPGVVFTALFLYVGLRSLLRAQLSKAVGAAAAGAFVAILVSVMIEASIWQVWRLAAMALAAAGVALAHGLEKR